MLTRQRVGDDVSVSQTRTGRRGIDQPPEPTRPLQFPSYRKVDAPIVGSSSGVEQWDIAGRRPVDGVARARSLAQVLLVVASDFN